MKKQKVNNKLAFNKAVVTELNDNHLHEVNGGTSVPCSIAISISVYVATKAIKEHLEEQNRPQ